MSTVTPTLDPPIVAVRSARRRVARRTAYDITGLTVTVHAAETSVETLLEDHLPLLQRAAGDVSADWAMWQARPLVETARPPG